MVRRLPPLNQLRAFEAAARHESIKDGARELCVTPAAVGHHVKALESALNVSLFHREVRKISLTTEGRRLAETIGNSLDTLEHAVERARKSVHPGGLKITVAPFFGNRWLLPRLEAFHAKHRDISIEASMSFDYVDLERSDFDAAVRFGTGDWEGMSSALIFRDMVRPVCAPQLVADRRTPLSAEEILKLRLACAKPWRDDWSAWAQAVGTAITGDEDILEYESRAFMFDAAISGNAVILADEKMTAADEAAGRLVCLNPVTVERPQGVYVVRPNRQDPDPRLDVFTNWLKQEALACR